MHSGDVRADGKNQPVLRPAGIVVSWRSVLPAALILTILLVITWNAGWSSGQLENQQLNSRLSQIAGKMTADQEESNRPKVAISEPESALNSGSQSSETRLTGQLRERLLKAQAEASQYRSIIEREEEAADEDKQLQAVLSYPGTRLIPLKNMNAALDTTIYALLAEKGKLLLIACRLPDLADDRQFQLWVMRRDDPKPMSAGIFSTDENHRTLSDFTDVSLPAQPALLLVTEEPEGGSSEPTGATLFKSKILDRTE